MVFEGTIKNIHFTLEFRQSNKRVEGKWGVIFGAYFFSFCLMLASYLLSLEMQHTDQVAKRVMTD